MSGTRNYDQNQVYVTLDAIPVTEFADGDSITAVYDAEDFEITKGSHGGSTRSRMNNDQGTITLRLRQGAPANAYLYSKAKIDRETALGAFSCWIRDSLGKSLCGGDQCWVKKPADMAFGTAAGELEWIIGVGNLYMEHGENNLL